MKKALLLLLLLVLVIALPVPQNTRMNHFPNEGKQHAMLRLEDVGPGGSYSTLEDLGKLRAVFHYLSEQHVPFHVATIPRAKYIYEDGTRYEKGIDDTHPDEFVKSFIRVLQNAQEQQGAVLGMHGYTHQIGDTYRTDGWQNTGFGFEFDVKGAPETAAPAFAVERITKSLAAFEKAGLVPGFWESPHYQDTREQEEIFRSFMGVLYQPDYRSLRSLKDLNVYEGVNQYGKTSLGSVYVPAPLRYIHDEASVDAVLDKLNTYKGLGAMYYHPFLEFPLLESVQDANGQAVLQDGIPLYRYQANAESNLHRLVQGFRDRQFNWVSLYDVVPFSPAHRIEMPFGTQASGILIGNVSGSKQTDVVITQQNGTVLVFQGDYRWPRNRQQKAPRQWLRGTFGEQHQLLLADLNGDQLQDLVSYHRGTGAIRSFASSGTNFDAEQLVGSLSPTLQPIGSLNANGDEYADLLLRDEHYLYVAFNEAGRITNAKRIFNAPKDAIIRTGDLNGDKLDDVALFLSEEHILRLYRNDGHGKWPAEHESFVAEPKTDPQLLTTDTNGDGRADLIVYDARNGIWEVLQSTADFRPKPIANLYGPWAAGDRIGFSADFDGNGKGDIASYDPETQTLDLSLSFRN